MEPELFEGVGEPDLLQGEGWDGGRREGLCNKYEVAVVANFKLLKLP